MNRVISRHLVLLLLGLLGIAGIARAAGADQAGKLRVLLITGGHGFDREPYLQVFRDNPEIVVAHVEHAKGTADAWDHADLTACDVVVLYDMPATMSEAQKVRFLALFERGVGFVVTHHALVSYQGWPDYERIIGGRYVELPNKGGDPRSKPSGYEHDLDIPVKNIARHHPVTAGVDDFVIHDELYWDYRVGSDVTALLSTTHPKNSGPIAWCRMEKNSRVVYILLGHGPSAFGNENFRRLLGNAIRWTAGTDSTPAGR